MALDQLIAALSVVVPIAKAMPLVGESLEGGLLAVQEICKMVQGTRSLSGECDILAKRACSLSACVARQVSQADMESYSELWENVEQFTELVESARTSLAEILKEKEGRNVLRRMLESQQTKERIQQISKKLDDGVAGFMLDGSLRSHVILEQLNGTVGLLSAASRRLEEGQESLFKGQRQILAAQEHDTRLIIQEVAKARGTTDTTPANADNATLMQLDPELSACYDGAKRVPGGADSTIRGAEAACVPGTRTQLLQDIIDWVNSPQPGLFWLSGLAGTGKTTIALTIAEQLDDCEQLLASFFILRDVQRRSRALLVVATIAYQIARYDANLGEHISRVLRENPDIVSKSLERQVNALIKEPLSLAAFTKVAPRVIVIDALDECDKEGHVEGGDLVPLLVQALPSTVKIILTGRPELGIQRMMSRVGPRLVKLHDMDADVVQGDIKRYLRYHLARLAKAGGVSPWPSDADLTELARRCGLLFVYAATIVRYLSAHGFAPQARLKAILDSESAPSGDSPYRSLDQDIYIRSLRTAVLHGSKVHPTLVERFQLLVGTIVLAQDPLPISSLACFVKLDVPSALAFLQQLSSVLIVPDAADGVLRVFHLSFSDFVTDKTRCPDRNLYIHPSTHHARLALRCLEIMNHFLVRDICDIKDPSLLNEDVHDLQSRLQAGVPPELAYACRHWTAHLQYAAQAHLSLVYELSRFIKGKLVYWIEVMSLLRGLPGALNQLVQAQSFCQGLGTLDNECKLLLRDCDRLVREFYNPIKAAALHVYCSALPFAPHCLLVDRTKDIQVGVGLTSPRHGGWNASLRTIEGHTAAVMSVVFSPEGQRIISGSYDNTVRVWDAQTGEIIRILEGHTSDVSSVASSPDGQLIASGSDDHTLRIWDAHTGESIKALQGHTNLVSSVAFSPDGQCIVSGSYDRTLRVWDAQTGKSTKTLQGHTGVILSVAFSLDGQHIVSGSSDSTILLWDAQTRENTISLKGHTDVVHSVAFSLDGQRIVSGSQDNTLRVWDIQTGKSTNTLKGHTDIVHSVAFSPDGQHIVSGSRDGTLRVWDTQTGKSTNILIGHTSSVLSAVFSPDGHRIVSGSFDQTLRVWDAQTGESIKTPQGHTNTVCSVAFSPDGQHVVSGSLDKTLRIWDVRTGESTKALKGHTDVVYSVAFSPDGQSIVSGSRDDTLRLWDAQTGRSTKTLKGHTNTVTSVVFSPDGRQIASSSGDTTLRVWNVQTGECTEVLAGHTDTVSSVAFSPDGKCIVLGSHDNTLRVWDAQTRSHTKALEGHTNSIHSVAFSPDGLYIVSRSLDQTWRVWDIQTGRNIAILDALTPLPRSLTLPSDGQYSAPQDGEGSQSDMPIFMPTCTVDASGWVLYVTHLGAKPQRRCWLPQARRPSRDPVLPSPNTAVGWHKDIIVTGGESGIVTVIDCSAHSVRSYHST